jgi:hypothetical protein
MSYQNASKNLEFINNNYYYIPKFGEPISWDIHNPQHLTQFNIGTYLGYSLQEMEKTLRISGLTFYVVYDINYDLPTYGENVVVIIVGDEWDRIPKYIHKVRAVFKCVGTKQILGCNPLISPTLLNLLTLIQFLRIVFVRIPGLMNYYYHKLQDFLFNTTTVAPIFDIPLGYVNSEKLPITEIQQRPYDAFFSGSVVHAEYPIWSLKRWLGTPKMLARKQMLENISQLQAHCPHLQLETSVTRNYHARTNQEEEAYSETMMNTKICLVPRGTSFETTRLFEGMRYGCIVVAEYLPSRWYLNGAPIIKVKHWSEIQRIIKGLVDNPKLMQELHQESLNWWNLKCSEKATGHFIAMQLNTLRCTSLVQQHLQILGIRN